MRSSTPFVAFVLQILLVPPISSHVVLEYPVPFIPAEYGPSNPVTADSFPCKMPAGAHLAMNGSATEMTIGDNQFLSFNGFAVHGGGSCQVSLTSDIDDNFQPNPNSRFFVIHSIESGCPARNQAGNLDGANVDKYFFKIPRGVEPGKYVLSWTWVARIGGGPEFYMQCAPIVVKRSPSKTKRTPIRGRREVGLARREDFPDLFMANMNPLTGDCTHDEARKAQIAIAYPQPGRYVERGDGDEAPLYPQTCNGNPRLADPQTPTITNYPTSTSEDAPINTALIATMVQSTTATLSTSSLTPSRSTAIESSGFSIVPITTSSQPTSTTICQEGYILCVSGIRFSTCTGGQWTKPQPLADGTKCTGSAGGDVGLDLISHV